MLHISGVIQKITGMKIIPYMVKCHDDDNEATKQVDGFDPFLDGGTLLHDNILIVFFNPYFIPLVRNGSFYYWCVSF